MSFQCNDCMEQLEIKEFHNFYYHPIGGEVCICKECYHNLNGPGDEFCEEFYERNFFRKELEYIRNRV